MDISLFLTSQNSSAQSQNGSGGLSTSIDIANLDPNAAGFFGALVEQMNTQAANGNSFTTTETASNAATSVALGGEKELTADSLLNMSGAELLELLRSALPDDQQDAFDAERADENNFRLSIQGNEDAEPIPFILNGFFSSDENGLTQYQGQLSEGLRDFLSKAQAIIANQGDASSLLNGYTPEQITALGDELASIIDKISAEAENVTGKQDKIDVAFAIHDKHTAQTEVRLKIEAEIKALKEEKLAKEMEQELKEELAAINAVAQGFISLSAVPVKATGKAHGAILTAQDFGHTQYRGAGADADISLDGEIKVDAKGTKALGRDALQNIAPSTGDNSVKNTPEFTQLLSSLTGGAAGLLAGEAYSDSALEQMGLLPTATSPMAQMGFTSPLTQAQSAAHAHPATNLVAATIKSAVASGESKAITIQLNPSELGRVEVKMEFGSDKTLKAVITAEKPETFMMMQRDAHVLERALQEAGLDTQGGLSFELAEHGFEFDQHNKRGGGHDNGGTGAGNNGEDALDDTLIETEMTWRVDPETGHMRYNILA